MFSKISYGACKKNLMIISFILMTLVCDSGVALQGEIRCQSLLGVKRLRKASLWLQNNIDTLCVSYTLKSWGPMCAENTSISTEKNAYRWKDIFDLIDA